jgi:DNA mismatch repair ATPase MutL
LFSVSLILIHWIQLSFGQKLNSLFMRSEWWLSLKTSTILKMNKLHFVLHKSYQELSKILTFIEIQTKSLSQSQPQTKSLSQSLSHYHTITLSQSQSQSKSKSQSQTKSKSKSKSQSQSQSQSQQNQNHNHNQNQNHNHNHNHNHYHYHIITILFFLFEWNEMFTFFVWFCLFDSLLSLNFWSFSDDKLLRTRLFSYTDIQR